MKKLCGYYMPLRNQLGATAIVVALMLTVLVGFVAMAIDIGYLMVTKNELQNVADGAALAACRQLGANYQDMTYSEQQSYVCDPAAIIGVAKDVGLKNKAARKWLNINDTDVEIGQWSAGSFSATLNKPDAVRVTTRRDSSANGPITTFFAGVIGIDILESNATSTAALTGQSTTEPGELELPVGISREWFDSKPPGGACGDQIKFSPTTDPDACAGWTTYSYGANANNLRQILDEVKSSLATTEGDSLEFTGGDAAAAFSNLLLLFKRKGYDVDSNGDWIFDGSGNMVKFATEAQGAVPLYGLDHAGNSYRRLYPSEYEGSVLDPDYPYPTERPRNSHAWETTVVVYENDDGTADCDNPNKLMPISGYARIRLTDVLEAPDNLVVGELICDFVDPEPTRGGGGESFGLMGSIPCLVE